ncbi:MAG: hypothetical protein JWM95_656 [Gemmatimonadetes bacterium]|nr:hypothetical protein [Gemmatimonadota bacterium]
MRRFLSRLVLGIPLAIVLPSVLPRALDAHEIPAAVTVLAFVKPDGHMLRVVLRVPLEAMRDTDFPLRQFGYLDVAKTQPMLHNAAATWLGDYITVFENGSALTQVRVAVTRISVPADRSFTDYDKAVANLSAPALDSTVDLPWRQAMLDVELEYPIASAQSRFSIHSALAHLGVRTSTVLRFLPPDGSERAYQFTGDPGTVALDPRWHQAALRFVRLGFEHILGGIDHLLFVLCLVIPFRRIRSLVAIITSFTLAHSITLVSSAMGLAPDALWFPPLIEALVALSIVYMALENIVGAKLDRRWIIAFGFGLVHGFAFSFALRETMQFAGSHLAVSLLSFNVGVELGQLFVLAVTVPALAFLFRHMVAERMGTIMLSVLVAHTAWHWMLDRGAALSEYQFHWPALDVAFALSAVRGSIVVVIAAFAWWLMSTLGARLARMDTHGEVQAP